MILQIQYTSLGKGMKTGCFWPRDIYIKIWLTRVGSLHVYIYLIAM